MLVWYPGTTYLLLVLQPIFQLLTDRHGCRSWHVSNSNSTSVKHLLLLPSPHSLITANPTMLNPSSIIHHSSSMATSDIKLTQFPMSQFSQYSVDSCKGPYLKSQDHTEVNLYGIAARWIVTVVDKSLWELHYDSHTVTIQWVHVVVDLLLPKCT